MKFILHIIREPRALSAVMASKCSRALGNFCALHLSRGHSQFGSGSTSSTSTGSGSEPDSIVTGKLSNFVNSHSIATVNLQGRFAHRAAQRRVAVGVMNAQAGQRCRPGCVVAEKAKQSERVREREREREEGAGSGNVPHCRAIK